MTHGLTLWKPDKKKIPKGTLSCLDSWWDEFNENIIRERIFSVSALFFTTTYPFLSLLSPRWHSPPYQTDALFSFCWLIAHVNQRVVLESVPLPAGSNTEWGGEAEKSPDFIQERIKSLLAICFRPISCPGITPHSCGPPFLFLILNSF